MDKAIGIIDSGVGGLTVAKEVTGLLPHENIIYFGDNARCPYGSRSKDEIITYTLEIVNYLMQSSIKALVIACNTITAYTLDLLQKKLAIPIIGVIEPGVRTALRETKTNHIAVLGTEATIRSNAYENELLSLNGKVKTLNIACPQFVPLVEKGILAGEEADKVIKESLMDLKKDSAIDSLILACTHYPLLRAPIQKVVGKSVQLISPSRETALDLQDRLQELNLLNKNKAAPSYTFITTGILKSFSEAVESTILNHMKEKPLVDMKDLSLQSIN